MTLTAAQSTATFDKIEAWAKAQFDSASECNKLAIYYSKQLSERAEYYTGPQAAAMAKLLDMSRALYMHRWNAGQAILRAMKFAKQLADQPEAVRVDQTEANEYSNAGDRLADQFNLELQRFDIANEKRKLDDRQRRIGRSTRGDDYDRPAGMLAGSSRTTQEIMSGTE